MFLIPFFMFNLNGLTVAGIFLGGWGRLIVFSEPSKFQYSSELSEFHYFFWTVKISLFFLNCQNFTIFSELSKFHYFFWTVRISLFFLNCQNFNIFSELSEFHYFFWTVRISLFFLNCQNFTIFSKLSEFHYFFNGGAWYFLDFKNHRIPKK
jgi:hypothetical protein